MNAKPLNRLLIIGSPGAGKSTISKQLSHMLQLPVIHLDRYYWKPNWVACSKDEWSEQLRQFTAEDEWIIDGDYTSTLDMRLERADGVIFMDMPRLLCLYRVIKRRIRYHGRTREDLNEECPEALDFAFLRLVWSYGSRKRAVIMKKLSSVQDSKQIFVVRSRREAKVLIKQLENSG